MKYRISSIPAIGLLFACSMIQTVRANPEDGTSFYQSVSGTLSVDTEAGLINSTNPLNPMNLASLHETGSMLKGRFVWNISWNEYLFLQLRPAFDWPFHASTFDEVWTQEPFFESSPPSLWLEGLELRLSLKAPSAIPWLYSDIVFGRLYPQTGVATIAPLSVLMDAHYADETDKPWLAGLLLYTGPLSFEGWCETTEVPQTLLIARGLLGAHEFGLLWQYDKAHRAGAWYRTALTDSLMTSFEYQIREDDPFSQLRERAISWNSSFLASLFWSPGSGNTGIWLEYRYRQNGLDSESIEDMYSMEIPGALATLSVFPWLRSPVHSAGLHIRNTVAIAEKWHFKGTLFWLGSTGFHVSALAEYVLQRRLSIELEASAPFHIEWNSWHSEAELWPYHFRLNLRARWKLHTQE